MTLANIDTQAAWRVAELQRDQGWIFQLTPSEAEQLARTVKAAYDPARPLFDYARGEFDLGPAWDTISDAVREAHHGRGLALVRGLPREGMNEKQFELLNWAIGLHVGVARPQGKASQFISEVRDVGTDYRAANGRGYSSNAKLDFHADGCDLVTLACYNTAQSGGQSMVSSSATARQILIEERPDLAEIAHQDFHFSRQHEQAPDEGAFYGQPLFDVVDGHLFGKWNRNRVQSAQRFDEVPRLSAAQLECGDVMDEILRRPDVMFTMQLEQGDLSVMNNHVMLHSRTEYVDFEAAEKKRLLSRLWLAPPDSVRLPDSWRPAFRATAPGAVRGGIRGHQHDATCKTFEARQAAELGMQATD